jgi:hypothetical protein
MNEYIIVNKTTILKRIDELEDMRRYGSSDSNDYYQGQIKALGDFLSHSISLIPEIEKAFKNGFTEGTCFGATTIYKYENTEDYISNLKLDI